MTEPDVVLVERDGPVATVTLHRPAVRNALSPGLLARLREAMAALDADDAVGAVVLTGADPAFCAGLDLRELGSGGIDPSAGGDEGRPSWQPWARLSTPVVGAVNGAAVTGGLELALHCDVLVASERARFADTHARVGVLPGWGLTVLLPLAVGRGLARRMSLTGDHLSAAEALRAGLVTEVVPHAELLPTAHRLAATIAGNDRAAVRRLLRSYRDVEAAAVGEGFAVEAATAAEWAARHDPAEVERRRAGLLDRGRAQLAGSGEGGP
ncbi:enoyl-CoA hydratase [Geodermatophilus telluris]|uniref:Enoyl-CoA hydratase n=1 Tax=Geodermatophilus telluris TaxID=1190417 RepID=A0A1G6JQL8_9ACTN|nr:enoyl-CoA hydratase [Geodermatophilus telluris]SDC20968.1 enoyl-CoA hydratase [Geodermatophilus telluris]